MLPVVDRPMIEWVLGELAGYGIDEAVLSLGYKPDAFVDAYPDGVCAGVRLHFAVDPEPLDTAGAIRYAARSAGIDDRFVAVNGDVFTDLDLTDLLGFHDSRGAEATIALHRVDDPSRFGVVPTDEHGRVVAFVEKPAPGEAPTDLINVGVYVLEPSVLDRVPEGRKVSIERETFPALVADGSLFALHDNGAYFLDTGTPAQYLQAQLDILDGVRRTPVAGVADDANVSEGAFVSRSVVRPGAVVEDGASVSESVVLDGACIRAGAQLARTIVGPGAMVGAGAVVSGCVVGPGEEVGDGAMLEDVSGVGGGA
jgi:mannose-1-phosphate guanylyltransferase